MADAPVKEKQVKLQVATLRAEESGAGIARIPRTAMAELGVTEGDVIQISGKRDTAARVVAPYAEDEGIEVIRLDGLQRANAGAGAGDMVHLSRVEMRPATRVVFAPAQENLRLQGSANALKRSFFGRPLVAGDTVATAGQQRVPAGDMPPQLRQMLNAPAYALAEVRLLVVSANPKGVVFIDESTEVELLSEYQEPQDARRTDVTYDDLGGLGDTINQLREMVELPLRYPELFQRLGVDPLERDRLAQRPATEPELVHVVFEHARHLKPDATGHLPNVGEDAAATPGVSGTQSQAAAIRQISPQDAKAMLDADENVTLLDVRTQEEYDEGHIEGAILLPYDTITASSIGLPADKASAVIVYCRSGRRSAIAAETLLSLGFTNVYDLGGIQSWPYETVSP